MLDPDRLRSMMPIVTRHSFTSRDTILYALGTGAANGIDASDQPLQFVYEQCLKALPTMAVVLAYPGFWQRDPKYGIDWKRLLHGEQSVVFHRPLPVEGEVVGETTIDDIYDLGADKGALLYARREVHDAANGQHLATVRQVSFLRGNGGFGGSAEGRPQPYPIPDRPCDLTVSMPTRPEQALVYRLSGDMNPLHADPAIAREAGYDRPILHGLCSYGIAGRAILEGLCEDRPERLRRLDVRFTAPAFPGDTITVEIWRTGSGEAAFRAFVAERGSLILNNGYACFD